MQRYKWVPANCPGGGGERGAIPLLAPCFALWVSREEGGGVCVCDVMVAVKPRVSRGLLGSSADLAFFPTSFCHKI